MSLRKFLHKRYCESCVSMNLPFWRYYSFLNCYRGLSHKYFFMCKHPHAVYKQHLHVIDTVLWELVIWIYLCLVNCYRFYRIPLFVDFVALSGSGKLSFYLNHHLMKSEFNHILYLFFKDTLT